MTTPIAAPFQFIGCVELRQALDLRARDERELLDRLEDAPAGSIFYHTHGYFLRHRPVTTLLEFRTGLAEVDASAIYFHMVEARARLGRRSGDFAEWIRISLQLPALAERLERIDAYMTSLERVRARVLALVDAELEEASA